MGGVDRERDRETERYFQSDDSRGMLQNMYMYKLSKWVGASDHDAITQVPHSVHSAQTCAGISCRTKTVPQIGCKQSQVHVHDSSFKPMP